MCLWRVLQKYVYLPSYVYTCKRFGVAGTAWRAETCAVVVPSYTLTHAPVLEWEQLGLEWGQLGLEWGQLELMMVASRLSAVQFFSP